MKAKCLLLSFITIASLSIISSLYPQTKLNIITFDNKSGEFALLKLIGPQIEILEIPNNSINKINIMEGEYYILIRYGDNDANYAYSKGEPFQVIQTTTEYSDIYITLHKVIGGNYPINQISKNEFEILMSARPWPFPTLPKLPEPPPTPPKLPELKVSLPYVLTNTYEEDYFPIAEGNFWEYKIFIPKGGGWFHTEFLKFKNSDKGRKVYLTPIIKGIGRMLIKKLADDVLTENIIIYPFPNDTISFSRIEVIDRINTSTWKVITDLNSQFLYNSDVDTIKWSSIGTIISQFFEREFIDNGFPPNKFSVESDRIIFNAPAKDYETTIINPYGIDSCKFKTVKFDFDKSIIAGDFKHCIKVRESFVISTINSDFIFELISFYTYAPNVGLIELMQYDSDNFANYF